jgi:hypothetical protein
MDHKRYRDLKIVPGIRGFKVSVGCTELYFTNYQELLEALRGYFEEPVVQEQRYLDHDLRYGSGMIPRVNVAADLIQERNTFLKEEGQNESKSKGQKGF